VGFEAVLVIIEVEEKFGVRIEDHESIQCATVGDLEQLVLRKLEVQGRPTQDVFSGIQQILISEFDHPPWNIRRETTFDNLGIT
jgi:hypothetical protein